MNEEQSEKLTSIEQLGEFGLIEEIKKSVVNKHPTTLHGIGDDAAVIDVGKTCMLLSTDMLLEGVHFDLTYMPLKHLGYKAVAVNVSDIVAMNGVASELTVSIGMSSKFTLEAIKEIYAGINLACEKYNLDLVGGDTTTSRSGLVLSITVTGYTEKEEVVYRSGAKENDIICVTGDLGGAYVGLQLLEREKGIYMEAPEFQPDLAGNEYILQRQLKPEARADIYTEFRRIRLKPTSMIDISDGLSSELLHIAKASSCGIEIFEEKLPIAPLTYNTARSFNLDPTTCAMNGGEDYELLFTIPLEEHEKVKGHPDITMIGYVKDAGAGCSLVTKGGLCVDLKAQGWNHFVNE